MTASTPSLMPLRQRAIDAYAATQAAEEATRRHKLVSAQAFVGQRFERGLRQPFGISATSSVTVDQEPLDREPVLTATAEVEGFLFTATALLGSVTRSMSDSRPAERMTSAIRHFTVTLPPCEGCGKRQTFTNIRNMSDLGKAIEMTPCCVAEAVTA